MGVPTRLELVTVIGSDLFDLDDDIKQYLQDPNLPLITAIKIGICYYVTADLILQLEVLKDHLKIQSFKDFNSFLPTRLRTFQQTLS